MAKNIYIVEDEPDIREALAYNFKKEGFNTFEFSNGEDCLQEITKKKPDVLILDIMLPGITGLDVCREIRSDEALSNIAIIMLTAKGEEIDRIVGFELNPLWRQVFLLASLCGCPLFWLLPLNYNPIHHQEVDL